ncbi:hypothetical protein [Ochrobactrum sp. BTU1]|uniref:hypothetical protein n=1 Tax=Ochrobactrum sp. BTU1 TaxID=2840456 RepID=UPI001C05C7E7|nr:hypothetical protein KMS41_19075 [Ochrobactrum sp. BTU1]
MANTALVSLALLMQIFLSILSETQNLCADRIRVRNQDSIDQRGDASLMLARNSTSEIYTYASNNVAPFMNLPLVHSWLLPNFRDCF